MTTTAETTDAETIRETTTELIARISDDVNVTHGVLALAEAQPDQPVYAVRNGAGGWLDVTISSFLDQVRAVAKGLIGLGVEPGSKVAVMSATSYSWAVVDQAIWFAGGISVPIYETSSAHQIAHLLADSEAKLVLIGDEALRTKVQSGANMAHGKNSGLEIYSMATAADLEEIAANATNVTGSQLEAARKTAAADDVATLVYTSGTTGKPKGVRITHRNLAEGAANIAPFASDILGEGESRTLLFLPLAHVLARAVQLICLHRGIQVAHTGDTTTLLDDLGSFRPTWLLAVPRVFEKVYHSAAAKAETDGKGRIFEAARATAVAYSKALQSAASGSGPGLGLRAKHGLFSRLVYGKLLEKLGGEVTHMVSGASPLSPEIAHFFTGIGVPIQEGYGLTESTAPITLNIPGATRIGSVGLPVPGNTVKIAEDGEVLLKGPVIFDGYHNNPQATAEAFDFSDTPGERSPNPDGGLGPGRGMGYFRSGDLGSLDADGFLTITGRKKELIVTAGGKNVYPTPMEESVRSHPLIAQTVVAGDNRPFVSALIFPDAEAVAAWAQRKGYGEELTVTEVLAHEESGTALRAEVQQAVQAANELVSRAESIREFRIIDAAISESSGHLTPSLKLIRGKVLKDYAETLEEIYQ
ncbi:AMP-dependent synthetase/ligase [Nesterenkonia ebinurensis]|uniref:AMP-dependent synthetase/ligase n=1 Tax=Nesterenkonia ebinurensis TaxID=2608252 RepID=UPI001CC4EA90|nr:AMP-dependent synthetase/ligase [Nesterenkonia ebinurensis]